MNTQSVSTSRWFERTATCLVSFLLSAGCAVGAEPFFESEMIFPLESWHNHGSCIVECPNGDLLVCWFHGSGERKSDDVLILGARRTKATGEWSAPFTMADTPGFPDTNCCMVIDPQQRLWLLWPTIQDNHWESALMKYKISTRYQDAGAPEWDLMNVLHMKPGDDFPEKVKALTKQYMGERELDDEAKAWIAKNDKLAASKLGRRLGWFTRAHPYILDGKRLIVGLYSDGFDFAAVTYTDDWGKTWNWRGPIYSAGGIQPSFARRANGDLVAYMRDNGPPPQRIIMAESTDSGDTWSLGRDTNLPNPGAGLELMNLSDGRWMLLSNDLEDHRYSLAVSISDDEGATWKWTRHLEVAPKSRGSFHYPSVIQSEDGRIHVSYSYFMYHIIDGERIEEKAIKHAEFDLAWVEQGDPEGFEYTPSESKLADW